MINEKTDEICCHYCALNPYGKVRFSIFHIFPHTVKEIVKVRSVVQITSLWCYGEGGVNPTTLCDAMSVP